MVAQFLTCVAMENAEVDALHDLCSQLIDSHNEVVGEKLGGSKIIRLLIESLEEDGFDPDVGRMASILLFGRSAAYSRVHQHEWYQNTPGPYLVTASPEVTKAALHFVDEFLASHDGNCNQSECHFTDLRPLVSRMKLLSKQGVF